MRSSFRNNSKKNGYTLLFAVLTAVLVLGVAVFILSVSKKQYALSVAARESTFAFYAADSGIECAAAAVISSSTSASPAGTVNCNGAGTDIPTFVPSGATRTSVPTTIRLANGQCAILTFTTDLNSNNDARTTIDSQGYNICNATGPDTTSPRLVERAIRLTRTGVW